MKHTKEEVKFEHPAKGLNHCKDCVHWNAPNRCKIVEGKVMGVDWCDKWDNGREQ
jgi:hypothetical protein